MRRKKKESSAIRQVGGGQFLVDWKKGIEVTKNMIEAVKKPVDMEKAKRTVEGYKHDYQTYKRNGGSKNEKRWLIDKGYAKRDNTCSIM